MTPQEIQRLLTELQRAYDRLGDTNPFRNFDTSNIQDAAATARQLEESLRGVQTRLRYADESLSDLAGAFKAIVGEITKSNTELSATTKTFRSLTSLSTKLRNDQTGISTLNKKDLISIKE
jgi:DNA repair ATPase RecN